MLLFANFNSLPVSLIMVEIWYFLVLYYAIYFINMDMNLCNWHSWGGLDALTQNNKISAKEM